MFNLKATFNQAAIHDLVDQSLVQIGRGVSHVTADSVHVWTGRTRRTVRSSKKIYTSGAKREVIVRSGGMVVAGKDTSDYVGIEHARHPEQYQEAIALSAQLIRRGEILEYARISGNELYLDRDNWRPR
jgi:hypothetical protein